MLAAKAKLYGARYPLRILWAAKDEGVPASWLFALIEQESQFSNIFGCDHGSILCHQKVTEERVQQLINYVRAGGPSNGIGFTQLTSLGYIMRAQQLGGAHIPRYQIEVGAQALHEKSGGNMQQAWRYNGHTSYQAVIKAKQQRWHRILTGKKGT